MKEINLDDARSQLLAFMHSLDIQPYNEHEIILDGELHRYRTHDDKSGATSGAYCVFPEGLPAGFVQDWRKGIKENWRMDVSSLSYEQRTYCFSEEFKRKAEEERRIANERRRQQQLESSERARQLWKTLPEAPANHEYLKRKKVNSYGLKINNETGALGVPLRNKNGELQSIQWIHADGSKRFHPGAPLDGAYCMIGEKEAPKVVIIGEGYATMAKVHELTNELCIAAISCHKLLETARILHELHPDSKILIAADDDRETARKTGRNPGQYYAKLVLEKGLAAGILTPPFEEADTGTDWDDYAVAIGNEKTSTLLKEKISETLADELKAKYSEEAQRLGLLHSEHFSVFVKPLPSATWLIKNWVLANGVELFFAPSGSGKSFITLDMMFSVACPAIHEWHGEPVLKHGHVFCFAGEGQRGLRKRCAGLAAYKGVDPNDVNMHIISDTIALDDENPEAGLRRAIANMGYLSTEPAMTVFDTTNCFMIGDENKTVDATRYLNACKNIGLELGCLVLIVNHTGHNQDNQGRARGSSVFRASADIEFRVRKDGNIMTLEMTKSKDTALAPEKKLMLEQVDAPGFLDEYGNPETTCVVRDAFEAFDENCEKDAEVISKSVSKKQSEAEDFARRTYSEAAKHYGVLLQLENGSECVAVRSDFWRTVCYELSSADNNNTRKQQFTRVRKKLVENLQILTREEREGTEYYCLKPIGDAYELGIKINIRNRV